MALFSSLMKLLVVCELCSSEQDVYYVNKTVFVGENDTVELKCHRRQIFECGWHISNQAIKSSMENNSTYKTYKQYNEGRLVDPNLKNPNIDIVGGNDTSECKLKIRNFSAVDEGSYTCQSWILRTYTSYTNYNVHLKSSPSNLTINGVILESGMKLVRGIEGQKLTIVCTVESGRPATTLVLSLHELSVLREGRDRITYSFIPTRKDNLQSIVCSAKSTLLDNPLSLEVQLDIQYSPVVKITSRPTKHKLVLLCNPSGNPENYTFGDWEHSSEFKEHIRTIEGAPDGTLTFLKSKNNKELHELDGRYKCKASNGIYGTNGQLYQTGTALVHNRVPPIFLDANKQIQIERYGQQMNLSVLLYNKYGTIQTAISKLNKTLYTETIQESIRTQDSFHDVNVTVVGVKIAFQLTLNKAEDFTDYTIQACNEMGCNKLTVKITSETYNTSVQQLLSSKDIVILVLVISITVIGPGIGSCIRYKRQKKKNRVITPTHFLTTEASSDESANYTEITVDDYRRTTFQENDNPIISMVNIVGVGNGDTVPQFSEHASSDYNTNTLENYDDGYEKPYTTLVVQNRADDENGIITLTHVLTTEASIIESVHYTEIDKDDYKQTILQGKENSIISTVNAMGVENTDTALQSSEHSLASSENDSNTSESEDDGYEKPYTTLMVQHRADDEHVYLNTNMFYENATAFKEASCERLFEFAKQDTSQIERNPNDYENGDEENANMNYIDNDVDKKDKDNNRSHIHPKYKAEYINLMLK